MRITMTNVEQLTDLADRVRDACDALTSDVDDAVSTAEQWGSLDGVTDRESREERRDYREQLTDELEGLPERIAELRAVLDELEALVA